MSLTLNYKSGDQLENFLILHSCGAGAYGSVFIVKCVVSGKIYALKIISENASLSERELNGIKQYQMVCAGSNLMQIYHFGKVDGAFYYTMDAADNLNRSSEEYIPDTLQNRIQMHGKIIPSELFETALQLKQHIEILHKNGLLHRDIKPSNIIFVNGCAMLGDIGLVTSLNNASLAGTAAFVSPQTAAGLRQFSFEDDFYALGKTIYCALTGYPPEKYPAFPPELNLSECRKVISLYNSFIGGAGKSKLAGKRRYFLLYVVLLFLSALILIPLLKLNTEKLQVSQMPRPALDIKSYQRKVKEYTRLLEPDEKIKELLPKLRREKSRLDSERFQAGNAAFSAKPSAGEIENISKNMPWVSDPETYLRIRKRDSVFAEFNRKHQNNPVVRYFDVTNWLRAELFRIKALADTPGLEYADFSSDFTAFKNKISELQQVIELLRLKNF